MQMSIDRIGAIGACHWTDDQDHSRTNDANQMLPVREDLHGTCTTLVNEKHKDFC